MAKLSQYELDTALNSKLIRLYQLVDVFGTIDQTSMLTQRQKRICKNSVQGEITCLREDIQKMTNVEETAG